MHNAIWRAAGRPHDSYIRDDMRIARLYFKYVFQECKLLDETARAKMQWPIPKNCNSTELRSMRFL